MSSPFSHILVVDDEPSVRKVIGMVLGARGYKVEYAADGEEALEILKNLSRPLVLCDLKMPKVDGLQFLRERSSDVTTILISAFATKGMALEAIKLGAEDYLSKPFSSEELLFCINKAEQKQHLKIENENLKQELKVSPSDAIFQSSAMREVLEKAQKVSQFDTTVLIQGESGSGKEIVARFIHSNSKRASGRFFPINCGAISESLVESELFGHKEGAFTDATSDRKGVFEEASGGTLFLDEVGELSASTQTKLLRTLQEKTIRPVGGSKEVAIDTRIIAASMKELESEVRANRFREDLFYRLNVVTIFVPPLRERKEDIAVLASHFASKVAAEMYYAEPILSDEILSTLESYSWPGNVRELQNAVTRAVVLSEGKEIGAEHLPESVLTGEVFSDDSLSIKEHCKLVEKNLIKRALQQTAGNKTRASKLLDISHKTLLYKIREYSLD